MTGKKTPQIGRFVLKKRLGKGSQGTVYLAQDPDLERDVAIKVLSPMWKHFTGSDGRFPVEAKAAARLKHPNIVSIFEVGEYRQVPYLVFEYVRGDTLRALLEEHGQLTLERAISIMGPVMAGMGHAHAQGVLHLDLSPGNILVDENDVARIMDFGLARLAGAQRSSSDAPAGTLRYMSPEHFAEKVPLGPYTDVYAMTQILYEVVVGRPAMTALTTRDAVRQVLRGRWDLSPFTRRPELEPLYELMEKGLGRNPAARFADGTAMKQALDEAMPDAGGTADDRDADPHGTLEFLLRRMQRRQDFPALSRSLADINRMTGRGSRSSAKDITNVILRDYALTNKLLKLANSAFYGRVAGEVSNISQAVRLLGFEQIRLAANSLAYFSHLQGKSVTPYLKDALIRSFLSGLLARHLARRLALPDPEEAFIAGMFQSVGENLTIYYFSEEHEEIEELRRTRGLSKAIAARTVLGIGFGELGVGVARAWKFPEELVHVVAGLRDDLVQTPENVSDRLRDLAVFANELCETAARAAPDERDAAFTALLERFSPSMTLRFDALPKLLTSGLEKLDQYASVLGMNTAQSPFCTTLREWLAPEQSGVTGEPDADAPDAGEPAASDPGGATDADAEPEQAAAG